MFETAFDGLWFAAPLWVTLRELSAAIALVTAVVVRGVDAGLYAATILSAKLPPVRSNRF